MTPKKGWGGNGLLGCDISFGYFNKIPLRAKDQERTLEKDSMIGVFGKLTGDATGKEGTFGHDQNIIARNDQFTRDKVNTINTTDMSHTSTLTKASPRLEKKTNGQ